MKKNMGSADRIVRLLVAALVGAMYSMGTISGTLGIVLLVLAAVFVLTSFIGSCPIYTALGMSTCPIKQKN